MNTETYTPRKIYIATKMRGLSREHIQEKLDFIRSSFANICDEVINFLPENIAAGLAPVECLGESIKQLAHADKVFIEKYEEARGVSCEEYICNKYHIPYQKIFIDWAAVRAASAVEQ